MTAPYFTRESVRASEMTIKELPNGKWEIRETIVRVVDNHNQVECALEKYVHSKEKEV